MKNVLAVFIVCALAGAVFASTSAPEGLPSGSGSSDSANYTNFAVVGDPVSGIIGNNYVSGVGLASMIFRPLLPTPGTYIPTITTAEGDALVYPNPFDPDTETCVIAYRLAADQDVKIYIIDMTGAAVQMIYTNSSSRGSDGWSRYTWDGETAFGKKIHNGVYLVHVTSQGVVIGKTKLAAARW